MTTKRKPPVDAARDLVFEQRGKLTDWESTLAGAQAELARLESTGGELALDDPEAALALPRQMQEQRDLILTAGQAIAAQRPRVAAAESAYLLAEADLLDAPAAAARTALAAHEARTAELLALLEEHEGKYVPELLLVREQTPRGAPLSYDRLKSDMLQDQVDAAEAPVLVLREFAAGREPQQHPKLRDLVPGEVYPACVWGPDALVPAPAYLRSVERHTDELEITHANLAIVEQRVADLEAAIARGESAPGGLQDFTLAPLPTFEEQLAGARRQVESIRARLGELELSAG